MKTRLSQDDVEDLGVWQEACMAGYPDDKANKDIQRVYLLGQLKATQSIHTSYGNSGTLKRIKHLRKQLALNESVKQGRKQSKKGR